MAIKFVCPKFRAQGDPASNIGLVPAKSNQAVSPPSILDPKH